jgi:hypothetical protein
MSKPEHDVYPDEGTTRRLAIGEIPADYVEPGGRVITTAEWINYYAGMTEEQKAEYMAQVEPPPRPEILDDSSIDS